MRIVVCFVVALLAASGAGAESPIVKGEPAVQPNGAVRFLVQGKFLPSVEQARESALRTAQDRLRDWLSLQSPPIRTVPTIETILREKMILHEFPPQEEQILDQQDRVYKMTMEIELQPSQVRDLRQRDRLTAALGALGVLLALLGVVVLFFRLDEWTKGYLTRWLMVGGVMLSAAILAVWWCVK
jgi:hypothetical protein